MSVPDLNVISPELKSKSEELLREMFGQSKRAFFDAALLSPAIVDDFVMREDVLHAVCALSVQLMDMWRQQFPDAHPLSLAPSNQLAGVRPMIWPLLKPARPVALRKRLDKASSPVSASVARVQHADHVSTEMPMNPPVPANTQPTGPHDIVPEPQIGPANPKSTPLERPSDAPGAASNKPGHNVKQTSDNSDGSALPVAFHLPNCRVGVPFSAKIEGKDSGGVMVLVADLKLPDCLGLTFDRATQLVTGEPQQDGEFDIDLQWQYANSAGKKTGKCRLISNPDPRSLWKVIEPADGLPYQKAHVEHKLLTTKNTRIAAASRRGRSHEHSGTFRDDDFFIAHESIHEWNVLIVADGAGSAASSREGSRLAAGAAGVHLVQTLGGEFGGRINALLEKWDVDNAVPTTIATDFHYLFFETASLAINAIEQEAHTKGAPIKDYSTTLLIAVVKKDGDNTFLACFWMGDGAIAAYGPRGTVKLMGTPDGGEYAGQTRFLDKAALADQGFGKRVRIGRLQDVLSVILMTDGVSDPYFETDNGLEQAERWDGIWDEIAPQLNDVTPEQRLADWLHFFKPGHHDDRTLALIW